MKKQESPGFSRGEQVNEWTAEKLDALPEGVVVEMTWRNGCVTAYFRTHDEALPWAEIGLDSVSSRSLAAATVDAGSIRVVSVPVDALLSDETVRGAAQYPDITQSRIDAGATLRAAIGHVTGEAS